jgi:hypothetical protein
MYSCSNPAPLEIRPVPNACVCAFGVKNGKLCARLSLRIAAARAFVRSLMESIDPGTHCSNSFSLARLLDSLLCTPPDRAYPCQEEKPPPLPPPPPPVPARTTTSTRHCLLLSLLAMQTNQAALYLPCRNIARAESHLPASGERRRRPRPPHVPP